MSIRTKLAAAAGAFTLGATLLTAQPALAEPEPVTAKTGQAEPQMSCFESPDNSEFRGIGPTGSSEGNGGAIWTANGEWLQVFDHKNNGRRIVAFFSWCVNNAYTSYQRRDSGPNEGPTDTEEYNYSFAEGRKVRFYVCEEKSKISMAVHNCSAVVYSHA